MNNTYTVKPADKKKAGNIIKWAVIAVIAIVIIASAVVIVPAGSTGVVVTLGKVSDTVMQEGMHFKIPFLQQVEKISNKIQVVEINSEAVSKDLQQISSTLAVNYRIGYNDSAKIYKNIGSDYENIVLLPAVQESMKSVTAKYTAEELITKRAQVGSEIKDGIGEKVQEYGIVIEKFNLVNFDFSEEFNDAIEAKQVAEQNLITTKTQQEQQIVIAEAEAKKQVIAAEAEATATRTRAEAQAEANKVITGSISPELIDYTKVEKWDGKLPVATGGNTFMDVSDLAN